MKLSEKIKYLMLKNSISQNQLAIVTNIERSTLTRILNGSTSKPRLETVHNLAKYFNVDLKDLINNESEKELEIDIKSSKQQNIQQVLTHLMRKTGILSITLLHKYTGIPSSVLSEILNGNTKNPNIKTLQILASFFNITVTQLTGMESIPQNKISDINPAKKMLPILKLNEINLWLANEIININEYTTSNRYILGSKSFAILIEDKSLEYDFYQNHTLIIDTSEIANDNDFIIGNLNNNINIFQFREKNGLISLRKAGTDSYIKIEKDKLEILGVVIQEIINRK